ncbi:endonuclease/exonuclease/phosphatase family protein [Pseudokineococcus sp. 1T1Z-3]|uniref:endonuclease/exonuclease/phosphatase family protein n=1 Tax=Pseudokineococcus sp. 1T1Z-3 TaxID=3132745 RepID=UPI0030A176CC
MTPRRRSAARTRPGLVVAGVLAALVAAAAVLTTAPALVGLSTTTGVAQAVALRGAGALALLVLAAALGVVVVVRRRRPSAVLAGALSAVLLACAVVHVAVLASRGVDGRLPGPDADLVVVALNAEVDGVTPQQLADLVVLTGADVLALPETDPALAEQMADAAGAATGATFTVYSEAADERPIAVTSLLVSDRLGALERVAAPRLDLAAVAARPVDGDGPVLVAVHPPPPIPGRFPMDAWVQQGATAVAACSATPGAVVAGDLNATLDHAQLRDLGPCVSVAQAVGVGGLGTWPAVLPPLLGSPIDHVLVDARAWRPLTADVVRVGTTDHRAVVVGLARR